MDDLIKILFTESVDILVVSQGLDENEWSDDNVDEDGWT